MIRSRSLVLAVAFGFVGCATVPPEVALEKALTQKVQTEDVILGDAKCSKVKSTAIEIPKSTGAQDVFCNKTFCSSYSVESKSPVWVSVAMTKEKWNLKAVKRKDRFHPDVCPITASPKPFAKTNYDLGHMWPAEDVRFSAESMDEAGSMLNVAAQPRTFNRGLWAQIEGYVRAREAASAKRSWIVTGPVSLVSEENLAGIIVPKKYFKAVLSEDESGDLFAYGFIATVGVKGPVANFKASIDRIEKETGFDLFAELPDPVEEKIEIVFGEPKATEAKVSQ